MKTNKVTKFLISALLLSSIGQFAAAADTATINVQATCKPFLDIQALATPVLGGDIDLTTGALANIITTVFKVKTNRTAVNIYQYAKVDSGVGGAGGAPQNAFFLSPIDSAHYIVLGNITAGRIPETTAVANCKLNPVVAVNNANAIAYKVSSVVYAKDPTGLDPVALTLNGANTQYQTPSKPGDRKITSVIDTPALGGYGGTYSYDDSEGTYQAIITCSITALL